MKIRICGFVIAVLLVAGGAQSNEDQATEKGVFPQENTQSSKALKAEKKERMPGFKKMKEEIRAKGINPDNPTNEDFRKALTGGRR